jgi:hypothetical protein
VEGFGEARLPELHFSPPDWAAGYPLGAAQSGGKTQSWKTIGPPNLPLGGSVRKSCGLALPGNKELVYYSNT